MRVPGVQVLAWAGDCERAVVCVVPHGPVDAHRHGVPWRRIEVEHRCQDGTAYVVTVNADVAHLAMNPPHLPIVESADDGGRAEARSSALVGLRNLVGASGGDDIAEIDAELDRPTTDVRTWRTVRVDVEGFEDAAFRALLVGPHTWCAYGEVAGTWAAIYGQGVSIDDLALTVTSTMSLGVTH